MPALDRFDLLHLESLLVAIEHGAGQHSSLAPIDLARGIETDPRIAEMASDDPDIAQWTVGAEVHRKWRQALKHAIENSELATVDALSGLPIAPVRSGTGTTPKAEPALKPLQCQRAQEAAILAKLGELGFDAQALPSAPAGKLSPAKQAVREALDYSDSVMRKAWQRLRGDGRIQNG